MSHLKRFLPSFGIAAMILYFGYHVLSGDQSVLLWASNRHQEVKLQAELSEILQKQAVLEKQNQLLRDQSLDLDYLSERVRAKLYYIEPNEFVIAIDKL